MAGFSERQNDRVDGFQRAIALCDGVHLQIEGDAEVMIAHQAGATEQRRSRRECAQARGVVRTDIHGRSSVAKQRHHAVCADLRYFVQITLEPSGALQCISAERIRRLQHENRLLALREDPLEIARGLRHRIPGHAQTLDRRISGCLRQTLNAGRHQDADAHEAPGPRVQHAPEDGHESGRCGCVHLRAGVGR